MVEVGVEGTGPASIQASRWRVKTGGGQGAGGGRREELRAGTSWVLWSLRSPYYLLGRTGFPPPHPNSLQTNVFVKFD